MKKIFATTPAASAALTGSSNIVLDTVHAVLEGAKLTVTDIFSFAFICAERARQRRQLRAMDARMLDDIGLCRADVVAETEKPFWRQ